MNGTVHSVEQQAGQALPEEFHAIVEFGILASQRDPFDPMEKAFHDLGNARLAQTEHLHADWTLEREYSLSPSLLAMSHVWKSPTGKDYVLATKGAPEAIADLCHLNAEHTKAIGEAHLRHIVSKFSAHYHEERPHQAKDNQPLMGESPPETTDVIRYQDIVCRKRLGVS